ncbi:MAG: Rieske 2Fe-2S domain-containing protein, partial [Gammaproteobacteria bacterium]
MSRELFTRVIMDETVLMYRKQDGTAVALGNRCPHRFAPLDQGKLEGDTVSCPYHGLRFDASGKCVLNPNGAQVIPAGARARSYPLVERHGVLWIWPGDPGKADPARIPDVSYMDDTANWAPVRGLMEVAANYRYVIDNLVDAAHVATVHHNTLACEPFARAKPEVRVEGDIVWARLKIPSGKISPIWVQIWEGARNEPVTDEMEFDQWAESGWMPGANILQDTGAMRKGEPREAGLRSLNCHLLTPATESSTHYFWGMARDFEIGNAELSEAVRNGAEYTFNTQD